MNNINPLIKRLRKSTFIDRCKVVNLFKPRYGGLFFIKKDDTINFIKHRLNKQLESFLITMNVEQFKPVNFRSETRFLTYGMVTMPVKEKLRRDNVYISNFIDKSNNFSVKLNLRALKLYSLFPGQLVVASGFNVKGDELMVDNIYTLPVLNMNDPEKDTVEQFGTIYKQTPLEIKVVSGPYGDNLEYLDDLLDVDADCLIILGPIITRRLSKSPNELFVTVLYPKLEKWLTKSMSSKIILVPSIADNFMGPVFPQDPYYISWSSDRIITVGNPSMLFINEILFAICTNDLLVDMSINELFYEDKSYSERNMDPWSRILSDGDRLNRLCYNVVYQSSFSPIIPARVCVRFNATELLDMYPCPDFLITSSKFQEFVRNIEPNIFINVGSQIKKENKRVCHITVAAQQLDTRMSNRVKVNFTHL